ncbi:hypothetical protein K402DRAFT_300580, partial [Aulographum hederae CBS 113979]
DVQHFASGLISRPYESTKHYTILRHTYGIVFYRGPSTTVAITVFADRPLPLDRTIWLQRRGFSGSTGLKIGAALGSKGNWIDVTPIPSIDSKDLDPVDERAWTRDVSKFLHKTTDDKPLCSHLPRETAVIRIPYPADDGYFRLVLCAGKKTLCGSPVFRLASLSTDSSSIRGASLATLPIELG